MVAAGRCDPLWVTLAECDPATTGNSQKYFTALPAGAPHPLKVSLVCANVKVHYESGLSSEAMAFALIARNVSCEIGTVRHKQTSLGSDE